MNENNINSYIVENKSANVKNSVILYGFHSTIFGECLIALTGKNAVCHLSFINKYSKDELLNILQKENPSSLIQEDKINTANIIDDIFTGKDFNNKMKKSSNQSSQIKILLDGSDFQIKVWQVLLNIPVGKTVSYQFVADSIGNSKAVRAVASAIARNKIAYLIPCHRVISKSGKLNKYRWGDVLKKELLAFEA